MSAWCALAAGTMAGSAIAAPPNDEWAARTPIALLPFEQVLADVGTATQAATDPNIDCVRQGDHAPGDDTVWYEYATGASDEFVDVSARGYDAQIRVFEGAPNAFVGVPGGCNDDGMEGGGGARIFGLRLRANTRYSILVANYSLNSPTSPTLAFSLHRSAVYAVTSDRDATDGVCDDDCSLRDAIAAATETPGAVVLPAGTLALPAGARIAAGGAWYGAGMDRTIVDAQGVARALTLTRDSRYDTFALHDLTLANGMALGGDETAGRGGALYSGASDVVVLARVAVRDSFAAGNGGGVYVSGNLTVLDSVVAGNLSQLAGGGIASVGWTLDIERSALVGNEAQAMQPQSAQAPSGGGGLYTDIGYGVRVSNTTVAGNRTAGEAAALVRVLRSGANIRINNGSIVDNIVGALADMSRQGGLKIDNIGSVALDRPALVANTVIAGNRPATDPANAADCALSAGVPLLTRYNLVRAPQSCAFAGEGDVTGADPQLEPLDVSGAMPVARPGPRSPLIDAGDPADGCERTDARGVARPLDGNGDGDARCDIGAVEREADRIFGDSFEAG